MLLNVGLDEALKKIGSVIPLLDEDIIPGRVPEADNSPYLLEYNRLFTIERRLAALLEKWLRPFRYELIGQKGLLCEGLVQCLQSRSPEGPF